MEEVIKQENIIVKWILWHFFEMPKFLISVWKNYILFATNYFSLILLLKTFIDPWRREVWKYPKALDIGAIFSTFISNVFSRVLGAMLRTALIVTGALFQVLVLVVGALAVIIWILIPFIIILAIIFIL